MSIITLLLTGLALLVLFVLSACFSGSETVLFSLSPIQMQRIRNRDPESGARLETLLSAPGMVLSTILVGNSLTNFSIASLGYLLFEEIFPGRGEFIAIPVMTVALLLFGEVTPKRLAIINAERLAPFCVRLVTFWLRLLRPFSLALTTGSKVFKKSLRRERRALSDDELMTMVEMGEEQGVLDAEEASMMEGIMRLSELMASDEMTPREDMVGLDLDTPPDQQIETARKARHRYMPVYVRSPDAIEGFLDTVQFLLDPVHDVRKATMPALFVPENVALDDLLVTFQRSGKHIACVLDEYGGTAGLITRGDILELITAPVAKDGIIEGSVIRRLQDEVWLADGSASLDEINHQLEMELDADDSDRIAGWITFHAGGMLPRVGQTVEAQGCRVTVRSMRKRRIQDVLIEILERPEPEEEGLPPDEYDIGYDTNDEDGLL